MSTEGMDRARRYLDRIDQVLDASRRISRIDGDVISATHVVRALLEDEVVTMRLGQILTKAANASSETRTEESPPSGDGEVVLTAASFRAITYAPVVAACFESGYEDGDIDVLRTRLRLLKRLIAADPEASRYLEARRVDVATLVRLIDEAESS